MLKLLLICLYCVMTTIALHVPQMKPLLNSFELVLETVIHKFGMLLKLRLATFEETLRVILNLHLTSLLISEHLFLISLHSFIIWKVFWHVICYLPQFFTISLSVYSLLMHALGFFVSQILVLCVTYMLSRHQKLLISRGRPPIHWGDNASALRAYLCIWLTISCCHSSIWTRNRWFFHTFCLNSCERSSKAPLLSSICNRHIFFKLIDNLLFYFIW